jgi:hypothetical protein
MASSAPLPPPRPGEASVRPPGSARLDASRAGHLVGIAGCAAVVVGSLGPWATLATAIGDVSIAGTSGDGALTIVAALVAAGGFATSFWWMRWLGALTALIVGAYDWRHLRSRIADVNASTDAARASVGWGLWVVVIGALVATVAAFAVPRRSTLSR